MARIAAVAALLLVWGQTFGFAHASPQAQSPARIFVFAQPFWVNLHHYLYVLGRVEAKMPDIKRRAVAAAPADQEAGLAGLTEEERQIWRDSVSSYANGLSRQDAVFDDEMVRVTGALIRAGAADSLQAAGLDAPLAATLTRAAPVYRKAWWKTHDAANTARRAEIQRLVDQHGREMLAYITRVYQEPWPSAGYPVNFSGFTNWAGAYSTRGDVLMMSGLDAGTAGALGFETVFHEAMHQWDDQVFAKLRAAAQRQSVARIPGGLTHAMIFFTAGEAARSVVTGHATYAEVNGMWKQGPFAPFKPALDQHWKPYLDGKGTLDAALDALIKAAPQ